VTVPVVTAAAAAVVVLVAATVVEVAEAMPVRTAVVDVVVVLDAGAVGVNVVEHDAVVPKVTLTTTVSP
jgi:hypothetical protein